MAGRPNQGGITAPPLFGHPYPQFAHPQKIIDLLVIALNTYRWKQKGPFFIDVTRRGIIGRRHRTSNIRLMSLGEHREAVPAALIDDRDEERMVRWMAAPMVGRIVQKGVATLERWREFNHHLRHQIRSTEHMDGKTFGGGDKLTFRRHDTA